MFNNYKAWSDAAYAKGCTFEHDGSGKIIAHINGTEHGTWDANYGGTGCGWFTDVSA